MFNVGGSELLIISLVALIVIGPARLPEVARQVGKIYADFKRVSNGFQRDFREAMRDPVGDVIRDVTATAELAEIEQAESVVDDAATAETDTALEEMGDDDSATSDTAETDTAEPKTPAKDIVVERAAPEEPLDVDLPPIESDR